jgi:HD-GYP domain-containing protein (c-di-GMP phosphodiesterase class II)
VKPEDEARPFLRPLMPEEEGAELEPMALMRRRFVEALRRAEIIALVNAATSVDGLARDLAEELCEAYDAEIAFVVDCGADGDSWRMLSAVGAPELDVEDLTPWGPALAALADPSPVDSAGEDLLGVGGRTALLAGHISEEGRRVLLGAVRRYQLGFEPPEVALMAAITRSVGLALDRLWLHDEREVMIGQLREAMLGTAEALANALEARDDYTAGHAREIAELAVAVGERLGMDEAALEELRFGGIFHDIGKIAVPDEILLKPGPLTDAEREVMKRHTMVGQQILAPVPNMKGVGRLVRSSHEHWDGGGYPDGLAGEDIPLGARVLSVVDAWHAMTSDRPYRKGMASDAARAELERHSGTQFDPAVAAAFLELLDDPQD